MLNLLSRFIAALQNFIEQATGQAKNNPDNHQPQILRKTFFRKKTRTSSQKIPFPTLQQRIQEIATDRWQWIRRNLWLVGIVIILLGVVYFSERAEGDPWWLRQGQTIQGLGTWLTQIWTEYQISIIVISLALILFLFGYDWLVNIYKWFRQRFSNLWRWGRAHILISLPLAFIFILLVGYTITNINTWVFSSVEVWSEESLGYTSEAIAIQFRGNLNAIGAAPFNAVTRLAPASPAVVARAKRSVTPLEFDEHCPEIMLGPQSFSQVGEPISLSRSSAVSNEGTGGGEISLNTTVGTFNLPLEGLIRFLLRYTPNYTELSAQIIPADRSTTTDTIRIVVNANDGRSWSVEGRQEELSQLINYLAHRLILDLQDNPSNEPLSEAELAMALGHQAYAAEVYDVALAYYRLAERFQPQNNDLQLMLGLIQHHLSTRTGQDTQQEYQEGAEHAFNRVNIQDAESNVIDLYPYLACFHNELGHTDQANDYLNNFNATLDPETPAAKAQRIAELKNKPALGTGRILIKSPPTGDDTYHLYYISNNAISYALNQPYNTAQLITVTVRALDETPHQIFVVNERVYYITADGLVNFFTPNNPDQTSTIFGVDNLQFNDKTEYTGGIRQIIVADEYILMVDQFGRVLRLRDEGNGRWPLEQFAEIDARQIVLDSNTTLYALKEDGTVWRINDPIISDLQPDRQVVFDTDNREIAVASGVIYALRANGNIWRYIDGESADTGLLIDQGVQTRRIILESRGLLVLKNSGDVWLIRNPQQPNQDDIVQLDLPNTERVAIAVAGVNLIALERNGQASLEPKIYQPRQLSNDDDGDGLTNRQESELGTDPTIADTDRDGLLDGEEVKIWRTDPLNSDTDGDTLLDGVEVNSLGLNPLSPDTDADGLSDGEETAEVARKTDPLNPDTDGDGLTDSEEVRNRLDPTNPDTDRDGIPDAEDADPLQPPPTATPTVTPSPTIEPSPTVTPTVTPTPVLTNSVREIDDAEELLINLDPQDNSTWFWLDRTEVTNRQYNLCFESGNCTQNVQGYGDLFYEDNHPVVGVNWQQAQSYCRWAGGRLPTAAEWRSATAPTDQTYLWGDDDLTCDQAVILGCDDGQPEGTRPVGSRLAADNPFGLVDMFGNVWEWTSTLDANENRRRVAGGSWSNPDNTPQGNFNAFDPLGESALALGSGGSGDENEHQSNNVGFRCARDYQPETP